MLIFNIFVWIYCLFCDIYIMGLLVGFYREEDKENYSMLWILYLRRMRSLDDGFMVFDFCFEFSFDDFLIDEGCLFRFF